MLYKRGGSLTSFVETVSPSFLLTYRDILLAELSRVLGGPFLVLRCGVLRRLYQVELLQLPLTLFIEGAVLKLGGDH